MIAYPTITDYLLTLEHEFCFSTIKPEFLRDENNNLIYVVGNSALIVKVKIDTVVCSLKLYTSFNSQRADYYRALSKETANYTSVKLPRFRYLEDEISVYVDEVYCRFPVLLTEWVEGDTLSALVSEYSYLGYKQKIAKLTDKFIVFARELLNSEIAYLDLKPENIVLDKRGNLRLIDIDALYVPCFSPEFVVEQGTVWYRHPLRRASVYDKYLQEYPVIVILLSLLVIEKDPSIYERYSNGENLVFSPIDVLKNRDKAFKCVREQYKNIFYAFLVENMTNQSPRVYGLYRFLNVLSYYRFKKLCNDLSEAELMNFDEYVRITGEIFAVKYRGLWSFVSNTGQMLKSFEFTRVNMASEGKIVLEKGDKWCVYNLKFDLLAEFDAQDAMFFKNGMLPVKNNGKWGCLDENYLLTKDCSYDTLLKLREMLK